MSTEKNKLVQSIKYWLGQNIFTSNAIQPIRKLVGIEAESVSFLVCEADNGEKFNFSQGIIVLNPIGEMNKEDAEKIALIVFPEVAGSKNGFEIIKKDTESISLSWFDEKDILQYNVTIDENFNVIAKQTSKDGSKVEPVNIGASRQVKNDTPYIWIVKFLMDNGYGAVKMESSPTGWVDLFGTPCASFSDENIKEEAKKTVSHWKQVQIQK